MIAEPYVIKLCVEGVVHLITTSLTLMIVDGAFGASVTTAAVVETMLEVALKPMELRACTRN